MADFLGMVKHGINKSVATVSTGSKNMVEKTKLNSCIKTFEDEKKQLLEVLGNKIFNFVVANPESDIPMAEVHDICAEIYSRNEQIAECKVKIDELDAEMDKVKGTSINNIPLVCTCGQQNVPGAKFCAKCGTRLG